MKSILLIRHGETDWNINRRFQGASDVPLNQTGIDQANKLAVRLQNRHFDAVYSSDLSRAFDTAKTITKQPIQADARLREMGFGQWEGLNFHDIEAQFPRELKTWREKSTAPPGGESVFDVAERVGAFLEEILGKIEDNQQFLVVAHGGLIGVLLCVFFDQSPERVWNYRFYNTSITEIAVFPFGRVLLRLNDTCHLANQ